MLLWGIPCSANPEKTVSMRLSPLLKEVPSLEDIHTCIQAIDHAPEKLQEILLNLPNDLRRNYYRKKFEKFDAISGLYLNRAIERGLPTLRNFIEEWRYDKDFKGFEFANDQLMSKINRLMDLSTPRDNSGNTRFDHESIKTLEILDRYFSNSDVNPEAVM